MSLRKKCNEGEAQSRQRSGGRLVHSTPTRRVHVNRALQDYSPQRLRTVSIKVRDTGWRSPLPRGRGPRERHTMLTSREREFHVGVKGHTAQVSEKVS